MTKLIPFSKVKEMQLLRKMGFSMSEIQKKVGVGYGSVFRYIRNIQILPSFIEEWHSKKASSIKRKKIGEQHAKERVEKDIFHISDKEKLLLLTALYWGEGSKREMSLINSDSDLIRIYLKGVRDLLKITNDRIQINIRIFEDLDKNICLKYWSKITKIEINKFSKIELIKGRKKGKLSYGMCRVRIRKGGDMLKYIVALRNRIIEIFD